LDAKTNATTGEINEDRRRAALTLFGLVGGAIFTKGCAAPGEPLDESQPYDPEVDVGSATQGITVTPTAVDSIAELRALTPSGAEKVLVLGYYGVNDGGGGTFYYDSSDTSSSDNGGTLIVGTAGMAPFPRWKRIYSGAVSVKWFGAKADGSTNDTMAIYKSIDSGANQIFFPKTSSYYLVKTHKDTAGSPFSTVGVAIRIPRSSMTFFGEGYESQIKLDDNPSANSSRIFSNEGYGLSASVRQTNLTFKDLRLTGSNSSNVSWDQGHGVFAGYVDRVLFEDIHTDGFRFGDAIHTSVGDRVWNVRQRHTGNSDYNGVGFRSRSCNAVMTLYGSYKDMASNYAIKLEVDSGYFISGLAVTGNQIVNCFAGCQCVGSGTANRIDNVLLSDNYVEFGAYQGAGSYGIHVISVSCLKILGNRLYNLDEALKTPAAIRLDQFCSDVEIGSNVVRNFGDEASEGGIDANGVQNLHIHHNQIRDCYAGITVRTASQDINNAARIEQNDLYGCGRHAIQVQDCSDVVVDNNNIEDWDTVSAIDNHAIRIHAGTVDIANVRVTNNFLRKSGSSSTYGILFQVSNSHTIENVATGGGWFEGSITNRYGGKNLLSDTTYFPDKGGILTGSDTYDPPSLADGVGVTTTVTVAGAALGDFVGAVSFSLSLQGITVSAFVSAADVVSIRFQNETGGTLNLDPGILRVRVEKPL
jgi:hypothetical protein